LFKKNRRGREGLKEIGEKQLRDIPSESLGKKGV